MRRWAGIAAMTIGLLAPGLLAGCGDDEEPPRAEATVRVSPPEVDSGDRATLLIKGFDPDATLAVLVTGPDGQPKRSSATTDARGDAEPLLEPQTGPAGTYTVVVTDEGAGTSARATFTITGGDSETATTPESGGATTTPSGPTGTTTGPSRGTGPGPGGGETSDLPECGPGIPRPCRRGGTVER